MGADQPHDPIDDSRRLTAASRHLVQRAREHLDTARVRLDQARNVRQVWVLLRALRDKRRGQQ